MRFRFVTLLLLLCLGWSAYSRAQQVRIVVLEAKHGKPVPDICLNVSLGKWHGAELMALTDKDGVTVLSIERERVIAEPVSGKTCDGVVPAKPVLITAQPEGISIFPASHVSCQYTKEQVKNPIWPAASRADVVPIYSLQDIWVRGIVAPNNCSKLGSTAKPGELVLFVRNATFMEGMRS